MEQDLARVIVTPEQIRARVGELGAQISKEYAGKNLLMICILKGAFIFMSDLVRKLDIPVETDFMAVTSYGTSTESSGVVRILMDLERSIEGRHIMVVEDVVDTGLTLKYIIDNLKARGPASVKVATFLDKPSRRRVQVEPDYNGYVVPDEFLVGYGLDFSEKYRNLPYVAVLKQEVYS
ncbi:MAG: hypoxanthine phosphoribosyltransferase [Clostridia bacterium]|nr:hypoxanthine phosphoribosyltransferase [Clostridia bacterium]